MPIETAGKIKPSLQPAFKGCVCASMYHDRFHHHFLFLRQNRPTRIDAIECRRMRRDVFDRYQTPQNASKGRYIMSAMTDG
jgi:hypothetical protein